MDNKTSIEPMVSVCMLTYKHEKYIAEAIEGVLMQQADFDIELIITNDTSPDNTDEIVKNIINTHPRGNWIRYFSHKINKGFLPNFIFTLQECRGKYIAFCSGDDYWVDPLKLQKQVDFLEKNPDYGLVHNDFEKNVGGKISESWKARLANIPSGYIFDELILKDYISSVTICARAQLIKECAKILVNEGLKRKWKQEDYPIWLEMSLKSKIAYFPDKNSHYRILEVSASQNPDKTVQFEFAKSHYDIQMYFAEREKVDSKVKDIIECHFQINVLFQALHIGDKKLAFSAVKFLKTHEYKPPSLKIRIYYWAGEYNGMWILIQVLKRIKKSLIPTKESKI